MNSEEESPLEVEIEALKAIYIHELTVDRSESNQLTSVKVSLHPATADNADEQYVRLDLVFNVPARYPETLPDIAIRNPRGLSDEKIEKIRTELQETAESNVGCPMLYQLIEVAKDHLTEENVPCCQCTICLYGFVEGDVFTKTQCYHYFHSHCLARYIRHALDQISKEEEEGSKRPPCLEKTAASEVLCPVCRLPISPEDMAEKDYPPPVEMTKQPNFSLTPEMLQLQQGMAELYLRQQNQGGIINVDDEKNKFLLEISAAPESSAGGTIEIQHRHHNPVRTPTLLFSSEDRATCYSTTDRPLQSGSSYPSQQKRPPRRDHPRHQHRSNLPPRSHEEGPAHGETTSSSAERNRDDSSTSPAEGEGPSRRSDRQYRPRKPFGRGYRQSAFKPAHSRRHDFPGFEGSKPHEWNGVASKPPRAFDNLRQQNNFRPPSRHAEPAACENGEGSRPRPKKSHSPTRRSAGPGFGVFGDDASERRQEGDARGHEHHSNRRGRSYGRRRDDGRPSRGGHAPPEACRSADGR
uniref:E3 ubiquitin-protein ligase RNF25 n=1 Tax=Ornithodoros turicata TaxID=34597 RepID=A0A2R5LLG1_9ACAR